MVKIKKGRLSVRTYIIITLIIYRLTYFFPFIFKNFLEPSYYGSYFSVQIIFKIPTTNEVYLVYDSSFADDYRSTLLIQLLPNRVPEEIRLVHLSINVAGSHFRTVLSARPNLTYTYSWEQTNVYTQTLNGLVNAKGKFIKC